MRLCVRSTTQTRDSCRHVTHYLFLGAMTATTQQIQRQYLRVKRPLSEIAPATLRLEGLQQAAVSVTTHGKQSTTALAFANLSLSSSPSLGGATAGLANGRDEPPNERNNKSSSRKRPTTAILKRVTNVGDVRLASSSPQETTTYRLVDAILATEEEEENGSGEKIVTSNKRRRLTLVESKTLNDHSSLEKILQQTQGAQKTIRQKSKKKKTPIRVLNPLERMVDESLKQVYQGEISPRQHMNYISQDESLSPRFRHWMTWNNAEMGNLLHACALWNDAELAAELLRDYFHGDTGTTATSKFGTVMDGDGRTPFQVAKLMGHDSVIQVLEAYGADTSNYVYDLYYLDTLNDGDDCATENIAEDDGSMTTNQNSDTNDEDQDLLYCQLQGGYGYWDEEGRLMLEAMNNRLLEDDLLDDEDYDDEDSNEEAHVANDYPDENEVTWTNKDDIEDEDESYGPDENDDDDSDMRPDTSFRHRAPVDFGDDDFDAAYGIYGQTEH